MYESHFGHRQERTLLGARESDVEKPSLLLDFGVVAVAHGGEKLLLESYYENMAEFETLCRVYGHQCHLVLVLRLVIVHVGHQRYVAQPLFERECDLFAVFVRDRFGHHGVEEFLDVFERRYRFGGAFGLIAADYTGTGGYLASEFVKRKFRAFQRQRMNQLDERAHLFVFRFARGLPQRYPALARRCRYSSHSHFADAARGVIDDALEGFVVARVYYQAKVTEQIFYLFSVEKRVAAIDFVRYVPPPQSLFHSPRQRVDAIQHGDIFPRHSAASELPHLGGDHLGLLAVGVGFQQLDILTAFARREALLLEFATRGVTRDNAVGGVHYHLRRTVVLFELVDLRLREIALETENVLDARAAKRVYALRVVAHDAYISVRHCESLDYQILNVIGVLIFVD